MKFKKVKIQAFRAYNKVEDATFDFSVPNQQNADFISLYAPNGFGKTSFYDAVEYAFTNNISRFVKKQKFNEETAKSQKHASSTERQFILRNTSASPSLETYVEVDTTSIKTPSLKRAVTIPYKGGSDFKFSEKDTQRKYFREVVLSQEWIDAFLMVDDAAERYKTFIEYFGDKKIDEYYRKLIELIHQNEKRIEELKKGLLGVQKELDFNGDKDILKKVNDKIIELKVTGESLGTIKESFTEIDSLGLSNVISERLSDLTYEKIGQEELIKFVDVVFSGNEDIKGLEIYFDSKVKYTKLLEKEKEHKELLEKFELAKKYVSELHKISDSQKQLIKEKEELEDIQESFLAYVKVIREIQKTEKEINEDREKKTLFDKTISGFRVLESDGKTRINQLNEEIASKEKHLKELPQLLVKYKIDSSKLSELQGKLKEDENKLKPLEQSKADLELGISKIKTSLQEINVGQYPSIFEKDFLAFKDLIEKIEKNETGLKEKKESLNQLNLKIKEQEVFNKDIEQFISKGAEIIDKTKNTSCPLCNHEYNSIKELSDKVSNNKLLSNLLSGLLKERSAIENQVNEIKEQLEKNKKALIDSLNKEILQKQESISELMTSLLKIKEHRQELLNEYNDTSTSLQNYHSVLNGLSYEVYEKNNIESLNKLKFNLTSVVSEFDKNQTEFTKLISDLDILENKIKVLDKTIMDLKKDEKFLKVHKYFKLTFPNQKVELEIITQTVEKINNIISVNIKKTEEIQKNINGLDEFLKSSTQELTEKQLELTTKAKELLQQIMISFEQEVNSKLKLNIESIDRELLANQLNQIRNDAKLIIERQEQKIKDYNLLAELKKNVEPYLKYEQAKKTEAEIKDRKTFLEKTIRKVLDEEKVKVAKYLDEQVNTFFYEDLINDLYRRIDPHPDYKKIKFICDFKDDKPKLNVCLFKDEGSNDPIIPNLYFSTAQVNILSLSIFLAKALNAKDDDGNPIDCIFIDDPIQSLDSINILSTIDLFRSLVKNKGKQIILSTHDVNFHNLLKKKMPSNLFKSKFMELETFGKVKREQ